MAIKLQKVNIRPGIGGWTCRSVSADGVPRGDLPSNATLRIQNIKQHAEDQADTQRQQQRQAQGTDMAAANCAVIFSKQHFAQPFHHARGWFSSKA
jgi:hypothetical protein